MCSRPSRSRTIVGSAVETIIWSRAAMNMPSMSPVRMITVWRLLSWGVSICSFGESIRVVCIHRAICTVHLYGAFKQASGSRDGDRTRRSGPGGDRDRALPPSPGVGQTRPDAQGQGADSRLQAAPDVQPDG